MGNAMRLKNLLVLGMLATLVGCGPQVMYDKEVSLELGEIVPIQVGPFERPKTVTVTASSPGAPISIYVHAVDQTELVDEAISFEREPEDTFAAVSSTEGETLVAQIPPETEVVVRLQPTGRQTAKVQLKISI